MDKHEIHEIESKISELQQKVISARLDLKLEEINKNKKYVGKCYRTKGNTYMKVVSEVSVNQYRVECVEFKLPIDLGYTRRFSLSTGDTYPDSEITCVPFRFRSVMANSLDNLTEIPLYEFGEAMEEYYSQLIEIINKPNLSDMVLTR